MTISAKKYAILLVIMLLSLPFFVFAQVSNTGGLDTSQISLSLYPTSPKPHEEMKAKVIAYNPNFFIKEIQWFLNGERQTDFDDTREMKFIAGNAGETTNLEVRLINSEGRIISLSNSVTPIYIDIILEADTYVPYFYQGRPLATNGSQARATALVDYGNGVREDSFAFKWILDKLNVLGGGILPGQSNILFEVPMRYGLLEVEVYTEDGQFVGEAEISLPRVDSEMHFYERSSLYGLQNKSLNNDVYISNGGITIEGAPYYISTDTLLGNPEIVWNIGYEDVNTPPTNPLSISLDRPQASGETTVNLSVTDPDNFLQMTFGKVKLKY
ncbi:hypothetical protein KC723_00125 [Candidatus Kaiserbacteria bacterium]|nr:hypothetical protein [Candidatus Kaiserbacteria bacterium]